MNPDEIQKQAKKIMDEFICAIGNIEVDEEFGVEREKKTRAAGMPEDSSEFRRQMFMNAPKKDEDFLLAEKKKW